MKRSLQASRAERFRHNSAYLSKKQSVDLPNISKTMTRADITDRRRNSSYMDILKRHDQQAKFFESSHYESMNEEEIRHEHRTLKKTLQVINMQLAKMLEVVQSKPLPSSEKTNNLEQILRQKDKEIQSNSKMMHFFSIEYALLLRRLKHVSVCSRELTQEEINKTSLSIDHVRHEMRELRKDNLFTGESLLDEESQIRQMRDLDRDRTMLRSKADKNKAELQKISDSLKELTEKIADANTKIAELETKTKEIDEAEEQRIAEQKRASTLLMRRMHLETLKKKSESAKLSFEQLYLQKLKELEKCIGSIRKHSHRTNQLLAELSESREVIDRLSRKVQQPTKKQQEQHRQTHDHFTDKNFTQSSIPVVNQQAHADAQIFNTVDVARLEIEEERQPESAPSGGKGGSDCQHESHLLEEPQNGSKAWRIHGTAIDLSPEERELVLPDRPKPARKFQFKRYQRSISTHEQEIVLEEPL